MKIISDTLGINGDPFLLSILYITLASASFAAIAGQFEVAAVILTVGIVADVVLTRAEPSETEKRRYAESKPVQTANEINDQLTQIDNCLRYHDESEAENGTNGRRAADGSGDRNENVEVRYRANRKF